MATFSKQLLSGSTNGRPIAVSASATPGTIIHTSQSGTSGIDEVWLYATNTSTSSVTASQASAAFCSPAASSSDATAQISSTILFNDIAAPSSNS